MGFEDNYNPILVQIGVQLMYAGLTLSVRAALLEDMSPRVLVCYRQCIGFFLILPFAYFSRRGTNGCRLNWKSFWLIFLVSFVGVTVNQNTTYEGLSLVSSPVASAMTNIVPAITFIMAYTLGLEKIRLRSLRSMAKIIGTILCVIGATTMALLKGPKLLNTGLLPTSSGENDLTWLLGCLSLFIGTLGWSVWLILQVHVHDCYPDHVSLTAWTCMMAALQSAVLTLIVEPNMNVWKLNSPIQIFACFYSGLTSAITFFAQAWCIEKMGPVFSAMFMPLSTVIITVIGCIFMHEELYTGSLIGGLGVIIGLYAVLWGKAKDQKENVKVETITSYNQVSDCSRSINLEEPLLSEN